MDLITYYLKYYIIPFLLILTILLIIILLFKRIRYEHNKPLRESISNKAETFLTEMILSNPNEKTFRTKLSLFKTSIPLYKSWCKEMIINDMIRFKLSLKGKASEQINIFYQALQLDKYSAGLIQDFRSFYKCEGFHHFQALDYKKGSALIKPYLKHPNIVIRSNANMAYISLSENHMESLKEQSSGISHLNMIKIMDILHKKRIPIPKNIDQWIETSNISVTKLGLKIMVFYNYRNQAKGITALLHHEDDGLKKEAITAIRELFLLEAKNDLIQLFAKESTEIKWEILDTLKVIGDDSIVPFLENIIRTETNKEIKLKAVECLNEIDKTELNILAATDFDTTKMTKHVREIYL
ncbi:HEAT repeat domain-containing protein [Flavobacterium sp. W20_MBD1_R3]|uniref:HEAT repeat domain-containing protein n=1 Tax=Flavobacterium sp. W20_MBD1_R3 TaxID=3240278 RepID=UPI003F914A07